MTQRNWTFLNVIQWIFFLENTKDTLSIDTFFLFWLQELNFSKTIIHWIEPFFLITLTELNPSVQHDSKNWTLLFNMTQRTEPFCSTWLKEFNPSFSTWLKELNPFFWTWLKEIEPFLQHSLKLNSLFEHDSKNWTIFLWGNITQNIEHILQYDSKNWTLFSICLNELDFFFEHTQRIELTFLNMTQRFELFSMGIKNWALILNWFTSLNFFWIRLTELNFFEYASKNWTLFVLLYDSMNFTIFWNKIHRADFQMIQRIEHY